MRRSIAVVLVVAGSAVAIPVVANAAHKPGHGSPGGGNTPSIDIGARPDTTIFRGSTIISGRRRGADNANKVVTLRGDQYPFGGGSVVASTRTDNGGRYSFTRRPTKNTLYRVASGNLLSALIRVNVRIRMSLVLSDYTPRVGQRVRFRGRACPTHDGLTVKIQKRTATGSFRTIRRTRLRPARRCSIYSRRIRLFRDNTFRVTADDRDHARGFSLTDTVNVHR
ncbi:MAG: hypothetical protein WD649_06210 [Thermoleophilaceae bacterium]